MRDKHIFSKDYEDRKQVVLHALRREDAMEADKHTRSVSRVPLKILACAALLSILTVSVYAATQWIEFRIRKDGDEVRIRASLNETGDTAADKEEKPLRSWRSEDGEISVKLNIPDLPADMKEDKTANGKYGSEDNSRSMTINGIDLRRSDLDQLIGGATNTKQFTAGNKPVYVIETGEADYYNRIAYIVFEEDELVLKLWVSYGITDEELTALASTMTLEYTTDALLAIPIQNEVNGISDIDIPLVYVSEDDPIYEKDLLEIGEAARDDNNWYTVSVNDVSVYDNINVLNPSCILRNDFVNRFTDGNGNLIPYNRTPIIWNEAEGTKKFGENLSVTKKLYVVTLTMADVTLDEIPEADRDRMLKACVNSFDLDGYTVENVEINMTSMNAVVDRKPGEYAGGGEIVYREDLGNGQWKVAYLIDEDIAEGNLVLNNYTGKIYVKIQ